MREQIHPRGGRIDICIPGQVGLLAGGHFDSLAGMHGSTAPFAVKVTVTSSGSLPLLKTVAPIRAISPAVKKRGVCNGRTSAWC